MFDVQVSILKNNYIQWSPAAYRQPRFRGEGLVVHCSKYNEIICKSKFYSLIITCVRVRLYDINDITNKYQPQMNENRDRKIFGMGLRKREFMSLFMLFYEIFISHDVVNTWTPCFGKSKLSKYYITAVIRLTQSEAVSAKIAAIEKTSSFECRVCDHLSYL